MPLKQPDEPVCNFRCRNYLLEADHAHFLLENKRFLELKHCLEEGQ